MSSSYSKQPSAPPAQDRQPQEYMQPTTLKETTNTFSTPQKNEPQEYSYAVEHRAVSNLKNRPLPTPTGENQPIEDTYEYMN